MEIAVKSKSTLSKLMPAPLFALYILIIWGNLTNNDPNMIPNPKHLLSVDLKHGTEK